MTNEPRHIDDCDGEVLTITEFNAIENSEGEVIAINAVKTTALVIVIGREVSEEPNDENLEDLEQLRLELEQERNDEDDDETDRLDDEASRLQSED